MGKRTLGLLLTVGIVSVSHAQVSVESAMPGAIRQSQTVVDTVGVMDVEGKELCTFVQGTGVYSRGADYTESSCQDFMTAVGRARPWSFFCWMSDPCSAQGRQPAPSPSTEE